MADRCSVLAVVGVEDDVDDDETLRCIDVERYDSALAGVLPPKTDLELR